MPDYLPADNFVTINENDSVLRPIRLRLPKPPPLHLIEGYGLPPTENYFRKMEVPEKLKLIEERARKIVDAYTNKNIQRKGNGFHDQLEFWKIIEAEKESLKEEIKWIKKFYWHMRYGYWFMCYDPKQKKSKPVWITPWHFFYLNMWWIDEAQTFPQYRDRDRRAEIAAWYSYTTTETFKDTDEKTGEALSNEMIDVGRRTMYGTLEPKRRRGGATARSLSHGLWILMTNKSVYCEIVADTGKHAEDIFNEKLAPAWEKLPMFIRPVWDGNYKPEKSIKLTMPKSARKVNCLNSEFGYTESSAERANDSRRCAFILQDEQGKGAVRADVRRRAGINKLTMSQMLKIHGYSDNPSTVEEMTDGGSEYKYMFNMSNFYVRNPSGQTITGYMSIFFPAPDGADGFIDKWGWSVIDIPNSEQIKYAPEDNSYAALKKGALKMLKDELQILLNDGSPSKLKDYRETLRRNPLDSSDCWRGSAGDMGFNILVIDKAIANSVNYKVKPYRMEWKGGIRDTEVVLVEDPNGRFMISDKFVGRCNKWKRGLSNHFDEATRQRVTAKMPFDPLATSGGFDSYQFRTSSDMKSASTGETNLSDGAGAVLLNYDPSIDGGKDEKDWETHRFICSYRARPSLSEYMEDMLMMAFYYGCMMNGERQTSQIIDYFIKRGYAGYLLYILTPDGKAKSEPCVWGGGENKQDMLNYLADHIEHHGHKERHVDILNEWKNIPDPAKLPHFDLTAATGWCIYGYHKGNQRKIQRISNRPVIDLTKSWMGKHDIA